MADLPLQSIQNETELEFPTTRTHRSRHRLPLALFIFLGILGTGAVSPFSSLSQFRLAATLDPTLSGSTIELLWAILAWGPQHLLTTQPLPPWVEGLLLPAAAIATLYYLTLGGSVWFRSLFALFFVLWVGAVGSFSRGFLQVTGADAVFLGLLSLLFWGLAGESRTRTRIGWGLAGFLMASGSVFVPPIVLALGVNRPRKTRPSPFSLFFGFLLNPSLLYLLHVRYPSPDTVSSLPPFKAALLGWVGSQPPLQWPTVPSWVEMVAVFPGLFGLLVVLLSLVSLLGVRSVWNYSAGRIVPVQMVLYLLVALLVGGLGWSLFSPVGNDPSRIDAVELNRNLRTIRAKVAHPTQFYLAPQAFGAALWMNQSESFPFPQRVAQLPIDPAKAGGEQPSSWSLPRPEEGFVNIEYTGRNIVRVAGEPLDFHPHYLLDASTEVWAATPQFFVGNDPADLSDQPNLFFEREPLEKASDLAQGIRDWNYDGGHFFLYKNRGDEVWRNPEGEWRVDYLGYLLEADFAKFGEEVRKRVRTPLEDFY